ncbi:hypothetical protein [Candidatus Nitrospira bockiana]
MKRDIDPVKIIKILPVPKSSSQPPFMDPGWASKLAAKIQRAVSRGAALISGQSRQTIDSCRRTMTAMRGRIVDRLRTRPWGGELSRDQAPLAPPQETTRLEEGGTSSSAAGSDAGAPVPPQPPAPVRHSTFPGVGPVARDRVRLIWDQAGLKGRESWLLGKSTCKRIGRQAHARLLLSTRSAVVWLLTRRDQLRRQAHSLSAAASDRLGALRRSRSRPAGQVDQLSAMAERQQAELLELRAEVTALKAELVKQAQALSEVAKRVRSITSRHPSHSPEGGGHRRSLSKRNGQGESETRPDH